MKITKEQVFGVLRHGLTFAGAVLLIKGYVSEGQWYELSGAAMTLLSVIWSIFDKTPKVEVKEVQEEQGEQ
jgi:hypothetical protein